MGYQFEGPLSDQNQQLYQLFHQSHATYLQHLLQQSTMANRGILSQLQTENQRQRSIIDEFIITNATYRQSLHAEHTAHTYTRQALMEERNRQVNMASTIHQQQDDLLRSQATHASTQQALELGRRQLADMAAELDHTQRKFHLVDSLVDVMLLQEDSQLDFPDRSRQITDVILDLENLMEKRYKVTLQERDERIVELEHLLGEHKD